MTGPKLPRELRRFRRIILEEHDGTHRWNIHWRRRLVLNGKELGGTTEGYPLRRIHFSTRVPILRQVENMIHEAIHATYPDLDEDAVIRGENNISGMLTAAGLLPERRKRIRVR